MLRTAQAMLRTTETTNVGRRSRTPSRGTFARAAPMQRTAQAMLHITETSEGALRSQLQ